MNLSVESEALEDYRLAYEFFSEQSFEYADHFQRCIEEDLAKLEKFYGFHPIKHGFHRVLSDKFQTNLYYDLTSEAIRVVAILDQRFSPQRIKEILTSRTSKS